ncbi:MAG: Phosphatidylglycerophosphatase A [Betaproteobacteria bacterium ADurb.Bin341]|nr:MAG: Phosphatidylglycerophosphatase A [Betaproteobacteria bacterium ADurb.Bin341]
MNAFARFLRRIPTLIATGFGLGYAPVASGTFGALLGCLIVWTMTERGLSLPLQIAVCAAIALACIPVCTYAEKALGGKKDDGRIVADEYLTFPICMLGLYDKWQDLWWLMPMCFVVSRVMDIVKPFPAYRLQKLPSGLGITIDDVVASLYALGANWALYLAIQGT